MQTHISTTPFGRRPISLGQIANQLATKEMSAEAEANKWHVFQTIRDARDIIGATDRALAILNALLSFHPETVLSGRATLIVWPSNEQLVSRANGMSLATLRRHVANLVDCGLVIRRDSPNGKRFARKGQGGSIEQAYGFDLSPLVARAGEFQDLANAVRAEKHALRLARERLTICRRDVAKLIETGIVEGVPGDWRAFRMRYERLMADLPRSARRQAFDSAFVELDALREEVRNELETFVKSRNMNRNESQNETHIQNSNPESLSEIEHGLGKKEEASGKVAEPDNVRSLPRRELPLGVVLDACPEISEMAASGEIRTWRDLQAAAEIARPSLGISPSAWEEALIVLGPENAAITVAAIYQRADQIANAGGYLRSLTDRAKDGKFSVWPMVMALLRANVKASTGQGDLDVRSLHGEQRRGDAPASIEISDALRRSMNRPRR